MLTWVLVVAAVLVIGLGVSATVVLIRSAGGDGIPVVSDIAAVEAAGAVEFSWSDPGIANGDRYQLQVGDGSPSIQAAPRFVVDARTGETVCLTVSGEP